MREIKFRAWDICHKTMGYGVEGIETIMGAEIFGGCFDDYDCFGQYLDHPEKFKIMQYTELNDKNGKEIYEGDLVEVYFDNGALNFVGEVVYLNGCFMINSLYSLYFEISNNGVKIVGNICENNKLNMIKEIKRKISYYEIEVKCYNCKRLQKQLIPKGEYILTESRDFGKCYYCGCESLGQI